MGKIVFFTLLLFICKTAEGQILPFTLGPQGGFSHNQLVISQEEFSRQAKAGFHAGGFARLTIKKVILQPEVLIAFKRGDLNFQFTPQNSSGSSGKIEGTQQISLFTADVPLMFGYQLLDFKLGKIRVMGGPMASYVLHNNVSISESGISGQLPEKDIVKLKDDAIWSIQLGAGIDLLKFTGDIRYQYGFTDISENYSITNNLWQFTFGYKIL
jgi:hypothetical protein